MGVSRRGGLPPWRGGGRRRAIVRMCARGAPRAPIPATSATSLSSPPRFRPPEEHKTFAVYGSIAKYFPPGAVGSTQEIPLSTPHGAIPERSGSVSVALHQGAAGGPLHGAQLGTREEPLERYERALPEGQVVLLAESPRGSLRDRAVERGMAAWVDPMPGAKEATKVYLNLPRGDAAPDLFLLPARAGTERAGVSGCVWIPHTSPSRALSCCLLGSQVLEPCLGWKARRETPSQGVPKLPVPVRRDGSKRVATRER